MNKSQSQTGDQKNELNLCVLVVYMVFWVLYGLLFFICSAHEIVNPVLLHGVGIASSDMSHFTMCIVLNKTSGGRCMRSNAATVYYFQDSALQETLK